ECVDRLAGGRAPDGGRLRFDGAPRFRRGGRALLFFEPKPDGTWAIAQFLQGAFHEVRAGGRAAALRDLSEVRVIGRIRKNSGPQLRDFAGFVDWIADRVASQPRQRDYLFRPSRSQLRAATKAFNLFVNDETGFNYRWFQFDTGGAV